MNTAEASQGADVDAEYIADHVDDPLTRIVEVDVSSAAYEAGHIPGAVLWNAYTDLRHDDFRNISDREMEGLLRQSGISPETTVVTYGYGAHLGYWLLRSFGHERTKLMDGPRDQWLKAGHEWSTDVSVPANAPYELAAQNRFFASRDDVLALADAARGVVVDVRSEAEYVGANFWPSGAPESVGRPGRIPGAIHFPVSTVRTSDGRFVGTEALRDAVGALGLDPSSEIVVYCTIGNRASQVWYALTVLLGFQNVRVFAESWVVWGMDPQMPIEH